MRATFWQDGVQEPVGRWDPAGLSADESSVNFKRRRPTERKHDRSLTDGGLVVGTLITVDQHCICVACSAALV